MCSHRRIYIRGGQSQPMPHAETESAVVRDQRVGVVWYDSSAFLPSSLWTSNVTIIASVTDPRPPSIYICRRSYVVKRWVVPHGERCFAQRHIRAPAEGLASMARNIRSHGQSKSLRHPNTIDLLSNTPRLVLFNNTCLYSDEHCTLISFGARLLTCFAPWRPPVFEFSASRHLAHCFEIRSHCIHLMNLAR